MFSLSKIEATVANVNFRAEIHGETDKLAADVKLEATFPVETIDELIPGLRGMLYRKAEASDTDGAQQKMALEPDRLTALRFPQIEMPLKVDKELTGYTLTLHGATGARSNVVHRGCKVNNWRFDCKEDGIVAITWRVIVYPETAHQTDALTHAIQKAVTISLDPPTIEEQAQAQITDAAE